MDVSFSKTQHSLTREIFIQSPMWITYYCVMKNSPLINIITGFYKNLRKCLVPNGYLLNTWAMTDYSNWIHLKLIIFILIIYPPVWQQGKAVVICFWLLYTSVVPPGDPTYMLIADKVDSALSGICYRFSKKSP